MSNQPRPLATMALLEHNVGPWSIALARAPAVAALLARRPVALGAADVPALARVAAERHPPTPAVELIGRSAVVRLRGVLVPRVCPLLGIIEGTPLDRFHASLTAAASSSASQIVIDIDSPGGTFHGALEAAAAVRRVGKPVVALAHYLAAGSAYLIGAAASSFVACPSSEVGAMGVVHVMVDESPADSAAGLRTSLVTLPPAAGLGTSFETPDQDAKDALVAAIRNAHAILAGTLAGFRRSAKLGGLVAAEQAREAGLVDRVASFEEVV